MKTKIILLLCLTIFAFSSLGSAEKYSLPEYNISFDIEGEGWQKIPGPKNSALTLEKKSSSNFELFTFSTTANFSEGEKPFQSMTSKEKDEFIAKRRSTYIDSPSPDEQLLSANFVTVGTTLFYIEKTHQTKMNYNSAYVLWTSADRMYFVGYISNDLGSFDASLDKILKSIQYLK